LNTITKEQLAVLAIEERLAQAIIDARDAPEAVEDDPSATPPYFAKNGPFKSLEELADLPDMTREGYDALRQNTSPYLGDTEAMNINTMPEQALILSGLTPRAAQLIAQYRIGSDGDAHEEDGVFKEAGLMIVQTIKDSMGVDLTGTPDGSLLTTPAYGVSSQVFTVVSEAVIERPSIRLPRAWSSSGPGRRSGWCWQTAVPAARSARCTRRRWARCASQVLCCATCCGPPRFPPAMWSASFRASRRSRGSCGFPRLTLPS
jgi:hypothetical protein